MELTLRVTTIVYDQMRNENSEGSFWLTVTKTIHCHWENIFFYNIKKDPKMQETKTLKREANISQIENSGDSEILV